MVFDQYERWLFSKHFDQNQNCSENFWQNSYLQMHQNPLKRRFETMLYSKTGRDEHTHFEIQGGTKWSWDQAVRGFCIGVDNHIRINVIDDP